MRLFTKLRLRLRTLLKRNAIEHELNEELRFHLEQQIAENIDSGMSGEHARLAAIRTIGGLSQIEEECRDTRGVAFLESLMQDVRYGMRQLRRAPSFTLVAVLTLALGIGANTAIFTVMNALMFKTLAVPHPEQLVALNNGGERDSFTYPMFLEIQKQQDVFSGVFASTVSRADLATGGTRDFAYGALVSGDYFSTLGVPAILGRVLTPQDDRRGAANVVVISYGFWQSRFGGDRNVIGHTISLDKKPFQIVGVTPQQFFGTEVGQQFAFAAAVHALEIMESSGAQVFEDPQTYWLGITARLKPGVTLEQARARLHSLAYPLNLAVLPPKLDPAEREDFLKTPLDATPAANGDSALRYNYGRTVVLLSWMVAVVLLIACVNVANLLLARASAHEHEYAVRAALGARRFRVLRQVLTESLLLSLGGVVLGVLFARWGAEWLLHAFTGERWPGYLDLSPDIRVLLFVAGVVVATSLLFGLAPAMRLGMVSPLGAIKEGSRATAGPRKSRAARLLISTQVALCVLLLFGAELLVRSLRDLLNQDLGFQPNGVLLVQTDLGDRDANAQRDELAQDFLARLQSLSGVQSASRSIITPISGMSIQGEVHTNTPGAKPVHLHRNVISPHYFATLGIPLIAGRDFDAHDTVSSPRVSILDEGAARKLFDNENPLGRTYISRAFTPDRKDVIVTVVGIAKSTKYRRLRDDTPPTDYLPIAQNPRPLWGVGTFEVRFSGGAAELTRQIEGAAGALDPSLSLDVTLLSAQLHNSLRQEQLMARLSSVFSGLGLLLAAIGIYGVMAYSVARRTNEIGIRMALGARRLDVTRMVLREALLVALAGVLIGIPAALLTSRLIKKMLFGVTPADPLIIAATLLIIAGVAVVAALIPARRAAGIDPIVALRYE